MVSGTFLNPGSAVDMYFGIGFVPDYVKVVSPVAAEQILIWTIHMIRNIKASEGMEISDEGNVAVNLFGAGCIPWRGGNVVTAAQDTAGNCLTWDTKDYSKAANHDPNTYKDIGKWNFVTARTGYWDQLCNTTYVGSGSEIWISNGSDNPRRYIITTLTGNGEGNGAGTAEVELNETGVPSGLITKISPMYDMKTMTVGQVLPAGFELDATCDILAATPTSINYFEAGTYDM
jgi:hypothetical protein